MNSKRRLFMSSVAALGIIGVSGPAFSKSHHHHDGKQLLGDKIKENGSRVIEKKGPHTISVNVKDGKIAGMNVKHDKKGAIPVKKYKTSKKMADAATGLHSVAYNEFAQAYSVGTTYIGYSYFDEYGDEQIYWWPYEMIYDGDTGAIEYVPLA